MIGQTTIKSIILIGIVTASAVAMSFKPVTEKRKLFIYFENCVGSKELKLDTVTYKNALGQAFTVTNCKYYISHIKLIDSSGNVLENKDGYYLVNEDDPDSHKIELSDVPVGAYSKISFMVGVDSIHNCSGAQSGALDPVNGMFWTWNSGYIFLKLEGKSPASKSPTHLFEYHIGGYKEPASCIRTVTLDIAPKSAERMHDLMTEDVDKKGNRIYHDANDQVKLMEITVKADINKIFSASTTIDISKLSSVTDFHNAPAIANNYKEMFRVSFTESGY